MEAVEFNTVLKYLKEEFCRWRDEVRAELKEIREIFRMNEKNHNELCQKVLELSTVTREKDKYIDKKSGIIIAVAIGASVSLIATLINIFLPKLIGG